VAKGVRARAGGEGVASAGPRPARGRGRGPRAATGDSTGARTGIGAGSEPAGLEQALLQRLEALEAALSIKLQAHLISVVEALSEVVVAEQRRAAGQACVLRGREGRSPHPDPLPPRAGEGG
jgi:hypothetical protein